MDCGWGNVNASVDPLQGHQHYEFKKDLQRGSGGFVQLAIDRRNNQEVAIKFLPYGDAVTPFDERHILRELQNHRLAGRHPNIVELLEVFAIRGHLAIVMPACNSGDMSEYIDRRADQEGAPMTELDAAWFMQQLVCAVEFCHRLGIANRDIKLDNMLLHGGGLRPLLRICDFGYSKDEMASISKSTCGTPEYMAPEVLFEEQYDGKTADVWSMGVSLFVMLTGDFPFTRASDAEQNRVARMQRMFTRIIKGDIAPMVGLSDSVKDLVSSMLCPDPRRRLTMQQVATHRWLSRAVPRLPPLEINDQIIVAMAGKGVLGRASCLQSAAEVQELVHLCAQAHHRHVHISARTARFRSSSHEDLASHATPQYAPATGPAGWSAPPQQRRDGAAPMLDGAEWGAHSDAGLLQRMPDRPGQASSSGLSSQPSLMPQGGQVPRPKPAPLRAAVSGSVVRELNPAVGRDSGHLTRRHVDISSQSHPARNSTDSTQPSDHWPSRSQAGSMGGVPAMDSVPPPNLPAAAAPGRLHSMSDSAALPRAPLPQMPLSNATSAAGVQRFSSFTE